MSNEGRSPLAMVYLLHRYFGRTGVRKPRRCSSAARATPTTRVSSQPSNEQTRHWLAFFMFAFFTDRDGKFQLAFAGGVGLRSSFTHLPVHVDGGSVTISSLVKRGWRAFPAHV